MLLSYVLIVHFLQNITDPIMAIKYFLCGGLGLTILEAGEDVQPACCCCCCHYHCCYCEHQLQNFSNPSLIIPHIGCISTQCSNLHL